MNLTLKNDQINALLANDSPITQREDGMSVLRYDGLRLENTSTGIAVHLMWRGHAVAALNVSRIKFANDDSLVLEGFEGHAAVNVGN